MKPTVIQMLKNAAKKFNDLPYTLDKTDKGYTGKSFAEVDKQSDFIAVELIKQGIRKNDKIAILSEGRSNWIVGEFGVLKAGGISVPLSIKLLPEEILFRLNHSDAKAIMLSHNTFDKLAAIWEKIEDPEFKIIYLDIEDERLKKQCEKVKEAISNRITGFDEMLKTGEESYATYSEELESRTEQADMHDVVSISYTSGTTGNPKGIMLTHQNYYTNTGDADRMFTINPGDRMLVILPIDHSFAHTVCIFYSLLSGMCIYFVDSRGGGMATLKNIPINLKEVNPHLILTVPALSGNFMTKICDGVQSKGKFINRLFQAGIQAGIRINQLGYQKASLGVQLLNFIPYKIADALVFKKVRQIFGNNLRYCVGGGALLDIKQQHFFYSLGVPIYQGYGLTEAAPIISANTPEKHKLGTSGMVFPSIECKIMLSDGSEAPQGTKGEIVIRGKNTMKGYYKNQEATKEALKDDWLYTGDLGYFDTDGFLVVCGREKALLISADGEKYSPEEIEQAIMNTSELVAQVMVYNDHKKFTSALITLDIPKIQKYIKNHKITDAEELLHAIKKSFYSFNHDNEYVGKFPTKWVPSAFRIVEEQFSERNKMINSTMKMVRYKIVETYSDLIAEIYDTDNNKIINTHNLGVVRKILAENN